MMQLSRVEKFFFDNPLRTLKQRKVEAPVMFRNLVLREGSSCLEVGCGNGTGALIINQNFPLSRLTAFDCDPLMVEKARKLLNLPPRWARDVLAGNIELMVADAADMPFADNNFDACFAFGLLHHIAEWEKAVAGIQRVLKPGGIFAFKEIFAPMFKSRIVRRLFPPVSLIYENDLRQVMDKLSFEFVFWKGNETGCFAQAVKR
ncbi:MAG: class I SAM-dependent methyltransferase [Candidatus Omnitrophica bacterium]|nr:class I SAM-dependent methyltransferase [Candidatus Omnitrophota bacterium]